MIFSIDYDVFCIFERVLTMNSTQRKQLAETFENFYGISLVSKLKETLARFEKIPNNCIYQLILVLFEDTYAVWANTLTKATRNAKEFQKEIKSLCHTICIRTNYELQQLGRAFLNKNKERLIIRLSKLLEKAQRGR